MDIDEQMVMLSCYLKYVIEWRRNAKIKHKQVTVLTKFDHKGDVLELCSKYEPKGNWDNQMTEIEI
jgi:type I restriction enzyme M protein